MKFSTTQLFALTMILSSVSAFAAADAPDSPLAALKDKYVATAKGNEASIRTFRANGESCGFIGGIIVGKMSESEKMQAATRQALDKALSAVIAGDATKKAAAKAKIDAEIASLKDGIKQTNDNLDTIKNALSTDSATCKAANKAFFAVQSGSKEMIAELSSARQLLDKQANLLTDGAAAYASPEANYDTAAARVEQAREESVESASAELK
ncbi:MAG: hypothetical protein ACXWQO_00140 [Bdellovibrionota bacterium]